MDAHVPFLGAGSSGEVNEMRGLFARVRGQGMRRGRPADRPAVSAPRDRGLG